jgi:hypothetical protein
VRSLTVFWIILLSWLAAVAACATAPVPDLYRLPDKDLEENQWTTADKATFAIVTIVLAPLMLAYTSYFRVMHLVQLMRDRRNPAQSDITDVLNLLRQLRQLDSPTAAEKKLHEKLWAELQDLRGRPTGDNRQQLSKEAETWLQDRRRARELHAQIMSELQTATPDAQQEVLRTLRT